MTWFNYDYGNVGVGVTRIKKAYICGTVVNFV